MRQPNVQCAGSGSKAFQAQFEFLDAFQRGLICCYLLTELIHSNPDTMLTNLLAALDDAHMDQAAASGTDQTRKLLAYKYKIKNLIADQHNAAM